MKHALVYYLQSSVATIGGNGCVQPTDTGAEMQCRIEKKPFIPTPNMLG